jgi:hypothetical protein
MEATGAVPNPVRAIVCKLPAFPESSLTVNTPFTVPVTVGAKVTDTVQLVPAVSVDGQLGVTLNPTAAEMVPTFSGLPPKLVIATGNDPLVPIF